MGEHLNEKNMQLVRKHLLEQMQLLKKTCTELVLSKPPPSDGLYCPAVFDKMVCINYTKAGTTAMAPCPPLETFNKSGLAHRYCTDNGTWEINESSGRPFTNMTSCLNLTPPGGDVSDLELYSYIYLFVVGASISLIFLTISLIIFFFFRQLRCDRVILHQNLFVSFALTAIFWIMYYLLVVLDGVVLLANPVWCQMLHIVAQFFTTCNFSWMFCESIYLHIIMVHAMRTGKKLIKCITLAGWSVPVLINIIYVALRWPSEASESCWIHDDPLQWIIGAPVLLSVVINVCVLINLVRLLVTKLKQIPDANQSRKAARAILILVPLFGLQFLLFPVVPPKGTVLYEVYLHFMAFLMSTQGLWVSIIFCFCNGEVKSLLRRKWHQYRLMSGRSKNAGLTSTTFVDPYSVVDTSRDVVSHKSKVTDSKQTDSQELRPMSSATPNVVLTDEEDPPNEKTKLRDS